MNEEQFSTLLVSHVDGLFQRTGSWFICLLIQKIEILLWLLTSTLQFH